MTTASKWVKSHAQFCCSFYFSRIRGTIVMKSRHSRATCVNCALEAVLLAYLLQYTDDTHRDIKTASNNTFI